MKEFGSDFQLIPDFCNSDAESGRITLYDVYGCLREYASGRHAIEAIFRFRGWKRIWIPAYFCYEVIEYLEKVAGIEIKLYDDTPLSECDDNVIRHLPYKEGDALLRMNFYGLRKFRSNVGISVPVIEDHTHDLMSEWAQKSNADYCIASVRKSMPTAAGGILWSPMSLPLPEALDETVDCKTMAKERYEGMEMKFEYLLGKSVDKDVFRQKMLETEEIIDKLPISGMDEKTKSIVREMDYGRWDNQKAENWKIAYDILSEKFCVLDSTHPFSIIILCDTPEERTALRIHLIKNMIYPAILWQVPDNSDFEEAKDFSKRMLSVHCDPRYSKTDIKEMCERIMTFKY